MKWYRWTVLSLTLLWTAAGIAAEPRSPRLLKVPVTPAAFAPSEEKEVPPAAAITPHAPVHYRLATWDIWNGTHSGYVYAPGACDYTPPCVDHLWDGYEQHFLRCHPLPMRSHHGCRGCNAGMDSGCGCESVGRGCRTKRAHAWHFGGKIWSCASCGDIAPSCGCDGADGKYMAPQQAPLGTDGPPMPIPEAGDQAPMADSPSTAPDKAARSYRLRGFGGWPHYSIQR